MAYSASIVTATAASANELVYALPVLTGYRPIINFFNVFAVGTAADTKVLKVSFSQDPSGGIQFWYPMLGVTSAGVMEHFIEQPINCRSGGNVTIELLAADGSSGATAASRVDLTLGLAYGPA